MPPSPYGSWPSPLDAAVVTAAGIAPTALQADGDALYWIEGRPDEGGRDVVVRRRADGAVEDVLPAPWNARTRVHEYGGGSYLVRAGVLWFTSFADQRIHRLDLGGPAGCAGPQPRPVTPLRQPVASERFADLELVAGGRWLVAVREVHPVGGGPADVRNDLVAVAADADGDAEPVVLASGRDFYAAPRAAPDGVRIAYLCWDHPDMPWDATELHVAALDHSSGAPQLRDDRVVAGGPGESVVQPTWSPAGVLHAATDRSGWWNLARDDGNGLVALHDDLVELGDALWWFGTERTAFLPDGRIACTWHAHAEDHLGVLDPVRGRLDPLGVTTSGPGWPRATPGGRIGVIAASPTALPSVVLVDPAGGGVEEVHAPARSPLDTRAVALPEAIRFPTDDRGTGIANAEALLHRPTNPHVRAGRDERPPLIVATHGGPTGHRSAVLDLAAQFWTSRGFAFVQVNYRGSTGRGRAYRDALRGRWGILDVDDAVAAARHLAARGDIDPRRTAIRGGSAGGYTTLRALTTTDAFGAGTSYFGVADVAALARDTHKFESRYLEGLIPPAEYAARSPITSVDGLRAPMLLLQGLEDEVVPPSQAEAMVAVLERRGIPYAYVPFEGEQHGFRIRANQIRALEAELAFYGEVFGFTPADDLPPLDLQHRDALRR